MTHEEVIEVSRGAWEWPVGMDPSRWYSDPKKEPRDESGRLTAEFG